jgi:hypothetical protein
MPQDDFQPDRKVTPFRQFSQLEPASQPVTVFGSDSVLPALFALQRLPSLRSEVRWLRQENSEQDHRRQAPITESQGWPHVLRATIFGVLVMRTRCAVAKSTFRCVVARTGLALSVCPAISSAWPAGSCFRSLAALCRKFAILASIFRAACHLRLGKERVSGPKPFRSRTERDAIDEDLADVVADFEESGRGHLRPRPLRADLARVMFDYLPRWTLTASAETR